MNVLSKFPGELNFRSSLLLKTRELLIKNPVPPCVVCVQSKIKGCYPGKSILERGVDVEL